jgi:hypothetical protein
MHFAGCGHYLSRRFFDASLRDRFSRGSSSNEGGS